MIALGAGLGEFRTDVADVPKNSVDDGDASGVGGTSDGQRISAVRQMVSATRLPVSCTVGS